MSVKQLILFLLMVLGTCAGKKRNLYLHTKDWNFNPNTVECLFQLTEEVGGFARINHITGLCDTKPDENTIFQVDTVTDTYIKTYEPVFEASNMVQVDVIQPVNYMYKDRAMAARFDIQAPSPNGDSMFFGFNNKSGTVWLSLKIDVSSSSTITSVQKASVWHQVELKANGKREIEGNFTMKYMIEPKKLKLKWDSFEVLDLEKQFEPYESIRFYSTFSTCHRIYFTSKSLRNG